MCLCDVACHGMVCHLSLPPLGSVFWVDFMLHYGHAKEWSKWQPYLKAHILPAITPVESKLHFHKHLASLLKMLTGSDWPGLGQETPDE